MFNDLIIVAVLAIILWIGLFVFYLISSRQQRNLEEDLQTLDEMLKRDEEEEL